MITPALLYRPNARWQIWLAFGCAAALHLAAVALARTEPEVFPFAAPADNSVVDVTIDRPADEAPPVQPSASEPPPAPESEEAFVEERSTPTPIRPKILKPVPRVVRTVGAPGVSLPNLNSARALAIYAPRPDYPYEARRERSTGSGLVMLTIDPSTGSVTDARMAQSTGSGILDNSAVSTLRRWRFKSGAIARVHVPITYTLTGASY